MAIAHGNISIPFINGHVMIALVKENERWLIAALQTATEPGGVRLLPLRRTRVVRIFPNAASCLRLVRALCAETHEGWLEDHRYLNMEFLKEQKKELRTAA